MKQRGRPSNGISADVQEEIQARLRRSRDALPTLAKNSGGLPRLAARQVVAIAEGKPGVAVEPIFRCYSDELHKLGWIVTPGAIKAAYYNHRKRSTEEREEAEAVAHAKCVDAELEKACAASFPRLVIECFRKMQQVANTPWDERAGNSLADLTRGADLSFIAPSCDPGTLDASF